MLRKFLFPIAIISKHPIFYFDAAVVVITKSAGNLLPNICQLKDLRWKNPVILNECNKYT